MELVRKSLTLPSGATTTIRKLAPIDFAGAGLSRPNTVKVAKETGDGQPSEEMIEFSVHLARLAVLKACGHMRIQGRLRKIVDKDFYELAPNEICLADVTPEDFRAIQEAVFELSGFGKEAAQAAETFPEKQGAGSDSAPAG
jgi:hypothetical protein